MITRAERIPFVELALRAARKAMAAAAYASARTYLSAGVECLPADGWEAHYELAFTLHLEAARATFFAGAPEAAQQQLRDLHGHARRAQDEAAIATLEIYLLTVPGRLGEAVEVMRSALRRYGLDLPLHPAWEEVTRKYDLVRQAVSERTGNPTTAGIEALIDLPRARGRRHRRAQRSAGDLAAAGALHRREPVRPARPHGYGARHPPWALRRHRLGGRHGGGRTGGTVRQVRGGGRVRPTGARHSRRSWSRVLAGEGLSRLHAGQPLGAPAPHQRRRSSSRRWSGARAETSPSPATRSTTS